MNELQIINWQQINNLLQTVIKIMNIHSSLQFNSKPLIVKKHYFGITSSPNINLNFNRKIRQRQTMVDPFQNQDQTVIKSSKSRISDVTQMLKQLPVRPTSQLPIKINNYGSGRNSQNKYQIKKSISKVEPFYKQQIKLIHKKQLQFQINTFQWRSQTHFPVIKIDVSEYNAIKFQNQDYYELKLRIQNAERVQFKLSEIKQFNLLNFIYIINEALVGFQRLFNHFGFFYPTINMIFITKSYKCKVWHDQNIWQNKPVNSDGNRMKTKTKTQQHYLRLIQIFSVHFKNNVPVHKSKQRSVKLIQKLLLQLQSKNNLVSGLKFINDFLLSYRLKLNNRYISYTEGQKQQLSELRNRLSSKFQCLANQPLKQQHKKSSSFLNCVKKNEKADKYKSNGYIWSRKNSDNSQTKNKDNKKNNNLNISTNKIILSDKKMKYSDTKMKYQGNKVQSHQNQNSPNQTIQSNQRFDNLDNNLGKVKSNHNKFKISGDKKTCQLNKQSSFKFQSHENQNQQKQIDFKRRSQISCSSKQTIPYKQRFSIQGAKMSKTDRFNDSQFTKKHHFPCFGQDHSDKNSDIQHQFNQNDNNQQFNFLNVANQYQLLVQCNGTQDNQNSPTSIKKSRRLFQSNDEQDQQTKNRMEKQIRLKNGWMQNTLNLLIEEQSMKNSFQDSQPSVNMNYIRDRALTKLNRIKKSIANSIVQSNNNY